MWWRANPSDLGWGFEVAAKRYGRIRNFRETYAWLESLLARPDTLVIRTKTAFLVASVAKLPYENPEVVLLILCGDERFPKESVWDCVRLLRVALAWAKKIGGHLSMDSNTLLDLAPLAKRIGRVETVTKYVVQ